MLNCAEVSSKNTLVSNRILMKSLLRGSNLQGLNFKGLKQPLIQLKEKIINDYQEKMQLSILTWSYPKSEINFID